MEQPANSSCFWLGLCLVLRYSIDFLSSVPLPSLRRYAPVLSIHSLRKGGGRGGESRGWCLCGDTDPIRSHRKGVEREVARQQRGIEFVRLRLQDEPWIWFLCYTSICYYIAQRLRVFVCLVSCMGLLHVWVCLDLWVWKDAGVRAHGILASRVRVCGWSSAFLPLLWIPHPHPPFLQQHGKTKNQKHV